MDLKGIRLTAFVALCFALGCLCQEEPKDNKGCLCQEEPKDNKGCLCQEEPKDNEEQTGGINDETKVAIGITVPSIGLAAIYLLYRAIRYGPREVLRCCSRETIERRLHVEYYENGGIKMREETMKISGRSMYTHGGRKENATQHPAVTSSSGRLPALTEA